MECCPRLELVVIRIASLLKMLLSFHWLLKETNREQRPWGLKTILLNCLNLNSGRQVLGSPPPTAHQRSPASADSRSVKWAKTAGLKQNKDDISGFLLSGGSRAVRNDKPQPVLCLKCGPAPPLCIHNRTRRFKASCNVKGNIDCDLLNSVRRERPGFCLDNHFRDVVGESPA